MYIELSDLILLVLFLLGLGVGLYIMVLVRNINSSAKVIKELLKENKENIDKTLKDLPVISKNLAEVSETAKNEMKVVEGTLNSINETVELTAAAAHTIKNDVFGKISGIIGVLDFIRKLFFKDKEEKEDKKGE